MERFEELSTEIMQLLQVQINLDELDFAMTKAPDCANAESAAKKSQPLRHDSVSTCAGSRRATFVLFSEKAKAIPSK